MCSLNSLIHFTFIAPNKPPYIAPATAGVQASCPAMYKPSISVSPRINQRELSRFVNSKLHRVPYDPPLYDCKKFESDIGVPHSYHKTFPFTCGTYNSSVNHANTKKREKATEYLFTD